MRTSKSIEVLELGFPTLDPTPQDIELAFKVRNVQFHAIDCVNWVDFPLKPEVEFAIAHSNNNIYVHYRVHESTIRAHYTEDSGCFPFEDSCVEFFVALDDTGTYYNIESNCIGAVLFKGGGLSDRVRYDDSITSQIKRYPSLPSEGFEAKTGDFEWTMTLVIPVHLLGVDQNYTLKGQRATANFYKCGDKLPEAQYLSWNPIDFPNPSFHRPEFFGELLFK